MHATAVSDVERAPREHLRALQLERLRGLVARLLDAVPVTRERLHAAGVRSGEDVRSLDDLRRLPFSMKSDLREHYPFGLLAVPREELVRVHASSGTGGKATVVGYTRRDLDTWTDVMARCLATAGVPPRDARAQRQRLRALHRRARLPPGGRAAGRDGRAGLGRLHRPPGHAAARPARPGPLRHPVLRAAHRPRAGRARPRARRPRARGRRLRRRAVDPGHGRGDRGRARAWRP